MLRAVKSSMDYVHFVGLIALFIIVWKLLYLLVRQVLFPFVLVPLLGLTKDLKLLAGGANWAVITGATDGIGKAYAKQLARRGFSVVLVSRSQEKLNATAEEINKEFPSISTRTVVFDFSQADSNVYTEVFKETSKLDVGVLVNNVGVSFEHPEVLHAFPGGRDKARDLVIINCVSPTMMSHIFLAQMAERNKGVIINIGSAAASNATPFLGVYSASKVFVDFLTQSLQLEYKNTEITFQCVAPFYVATKMSRLKRSSFFAPDPNSFAASALNTVGWVRRTPGCFGHALQAAFLDILPEQLIILHMLRLMQKVRKAALRKKAKEQ